MKKIFIICFLILFAQFSIYAQVRPGTKIDKRKVPKTRAIPSKPAKPASGLKPKPASDDCCVPMDKELLSSMFIHEPTGSLSDPYRLKLDQNSSFFSIFQAYTTYIKLLNPSIDKVVFHWKLIELQTNAATGDPIDSWTPAAQGGPNDFHNWFVPTGNSAQFVGNGNSDFFNIDLEVGKWYRVHLGIFTEPDQCKGGGHFFYRVQLINGSYMSQASDGRRVFKTKKVRAKSRSRRN